MKRDIFIALALLLMPCAAIAQSSNHFGVFPTIDHSGTLSKRFDYSLYYFGALNLINEKIDGAADLPTFFAFYSEQALTYKLNPAISFTGSYVYERQRPLEDGYRNENRFYVQTTWKYKVNNSGLKHRLRFDGRYIENRTTGKSPFSSRLRYLTGITAPLQKSGRLYVNAYNEFFFSTDKRPAAVYTENWAYAGIGIQTPKAGNFELGPLYIFWVNNRNNGMSHFYYLQLTWSTHVDLSKNKDRKTG